MHIRSRITVVVMAALLAMPAVALSKEHGRGEGRSGKSSSRSIQSRSERHGGGSRDRGSWSRPSRSKERSFTRSIDSARERGLRSRSNGSRERSLARRVDAPRERWSSRPNVSRERTLARNFDTSRERSPRPSTSRERSWRSSGDSRERVSRTRSERVYRTPSAGRVERGDREIVRRVTRGDGDRRIARGSSDRRWRDGGSSRGYSRDTRAYTRYRGDGGSTRYKPSGPIIRRGGGDVHYTRHYYTSNFYRPRYIARSSFWIGLSIGAYPAYGYRYWDPYCGLHFSSLVPYYTHCHGHGHPSAILVIDHRSRAPIATCVYDDGEWVVDDCAHDDYAYEDEYYDDEVYYEEY
jgi:hypothetical protein